jgi:hypothetical protein
MRPPAAFHLAPTALLSAAPLPASLCSYAELGGSLLDEIGQQTSLEGVRAYLRVMRDR